MYNPRYNQLALITMPIFLHQVHGLFLHQVLKILTKLQNHLKWPEKNNMSEIWKTWPGPEENLKRLSPMGNPILFSDKNARQSGSCHLKDTTFLMISIHQHHNKWWLGNHFRNWFMMVSDDQAFRPVTTMGILRSMNFQDQMVKPPTSDGFRLSDYPWISMIPWSNGETLRGIPPSTARRVHWPLSVWGSKRAYDALTMDMMWVTGFHACIWFLKRNHHSKIIR